MFRKPDTDFLLTNRVRSNLACGAEELEPGHSNALPPNNLRPLLARAHCAAHHAERDGYIRILVLGGIETTTLAILEQTKPISDGP